MRSPRHLGSTPTDRQLWPYYRAVLDANVDRLVVPDEPDLIYPGQTFMLPPPPHRPRRPSVLRP
jgi:nucleoid-associated protein YgaU